MKRNRHEISLEILEFCKAPRVKTKIMSVIGLSYRQLLQYLFNMQNVGLLSLKPDSRYVTTKKGREILEKCKECCVLLGWRTQKNLKGVKL